MRFFGLRFGLVIATKLLVLGGATPGQETTTPKTTVFRITKAHSTIGFSVYKWMVMKEEGVFRDFNGQIVYDSNRPDLSQIDMTVQAASLDTGNATRDSVLRSDDFFDVAKYTTLHFVSDKVVPKGGNEIEVSGELTIHGVTKRITIPARINGTSTVPGVGTLAGFEATF